MATTLAVRGSQQIIWEDMNSRIPYTRNIFRSKFGVAPMNQDNMGNNVYFSSWHSKCSSADLGTILDLGQGCCWNLSYENLRLDLFHWHSCARSGCHKKQSFGNLISKVHIFLQNKKIRFSWFLHYVFNTKGKGRIPYQILNGAIYIDISFLSIILFYLIIIMSIVFMLNIRFYNNFLRIQSVVRRIYGFFFVCVSFCKKIPLDYKRFSPV